MTLRSPLKKARGLGSAKEGSHHWWMQRVTAVALIPLGIWFVVSVIRMMEAPEGVIHALHSPAQAVAMILFIGVALIHGSLGVQVVIEDYVSCKCARTILITLVKFTSIFLAILATLSVVYFHVNGGVRDWDMNDYKGTHEVPAMHQTHVNADTKHSEQV